MILGRPWIVAVSGVMGSGKTTLSRALAAHLGWHYLPEPTSVAKMVTDLFSDPERYAFETQSGFFLNKAVQVMRATLSGVQGIILDRSLEEDAQVFAKYFHEEGYIEERAYQTYKNLASHFFTLLPTPDIFIQCDAPLAVLKDRIRRRGRTFEDRYPQGHLTRIFNRYAKWNEDHLPASIYTTLDTAKVDCRSTSITQEIATDIRVILERLTAVPQQRDLFRSVEHTLESPNHLCVVSMPSLPRDLVKRILPEVGLARQALSYPSAYIAAPFTAFATELENRTLSDGLLNIEPSYGVIPKGPYRSFLTGVVSELKRIGINCFLPHRDLNDWDENTLLLQPWLVCVLIW